MPSTSRVDDNEHDYEPSSSDEDYDENEKRLLQKFRNSRQDDSESETEVFAVGVDSEADSEDKSDIALSDVEGQDDDDDLPDARAWGKEKKKYYGADYVDPDYGGFQGKDAEAAEIEEEEAKNLQNQLIQQLDDDDFAFDIIFKKKDDEQKEDSSKEVIKTDITKLSEKEKLQMLQKDSPEMFGLIGDFEGKMIIVRDYLLPVIEKHKGGEIPTTRAVEFVEKHYQLICSYLCNIYMYLLLKTNKQLKNHPVIKKLYQYRQLLLQLEPVFDEVIKPQIETLLQGQVEQSSKITNSIKSKKGTKKLIKTKSNGVEPPSKKLKLNDKDQKQVSFDLEQSSELKDVEASIQDENESEAVGKRAITYQIAKNKGLTPHRKKEFRNPRVKHKLKYRKAIIRRKGAVREPRKELSRYAGEISGIKAYVSKSIKFKS